MAAALVLAGSAEKCIWKTSVSAFSTILGRPSCWRQPVKGKVFKKVEIHGTGTYGDAGEQVYLKVELENVQITSYQLGVLDNNAATDDLLLNLDFEKYKTTFTEYGRDGTKGGSVEFEWKVEEGES